MKYAALLVALLTGCASPPEPRNPAPVRKPAQTPLFGAHCGVCKQCGGGLLDENGQEQGLCEEGFRLWQDDLRKAMGK